MTTSRPATKRKKPRGRPFHRPDNRTRALVLALAFEGVSQARIAMHVKLDPKTLRKHYGHELDHGTELTCARVAQNMVAIACRANGGSAAVSAGRFILSCKAGWKETSRIELEEKGKGLGAILTMLSNAPPPEALEENEHCHPATIN
jgi:hypothetical protein